MSGKSEMTAWKYAFFEIYSPLMYSVRREEGANAIFFSAKYMLSTEPNERKSPKADVPKVRLRLSANKTWGESVQMYLVFMETSVVLFRRSFLFRSTNRNWSAQRGISPEKWPSTNLFPLEICLCRTRCLSLQWFPMENK